MDAAIEEGAGGDDHLAGGDGLSLHRLHPAHLIVADDEGGDGILAEGEVLLVFEDGLPEEGELLLSILNCIMVLSVTMPVMPPRASISRTI